MAYCRTVAILSAIGLAIAASPVQYPPAPAPRELSPSPSPVPVPSPSTPPPPVATPAPKVAQPVTAPTGQQPTWAPAPVAPPVTAAPVTAAPYVAPVAPVTAAPYVAPVAPVTAAPYVAPVATPPPFTPAVLAPTGTPADLGSSALTPELIQTLRQFPEKIRELPMEVRMKIENNPDFIKARGTVDQAVTAVKNIPAMVDQLPAKFKAMPQDEQTGIVLGSAAGTAALAATIGAIAKAAEKDRQKARDAAQHAETWQAKEVAKQIQAKEVASQMPVEPAPVAIGPAVTLTSGVTATPSPAYIKLKSLYVKKVEPAVQEISGSGVDGLILGIGSFMLFSCFFVMVTGLLFYKFCGRSESSAGAESRSFTRVSEEEDDDDEYA